MDFCIMIIMNKYWRTQQEFFFYIICGGDLHNWTCYIYTKITENYIFS